VVLLARGQRALGHVHVHHLAGAGLQRHHRKGAGIGEQVEHLEAEAVLGVGGHMGMHPAPALGHVQEQAVVLAAQHMHAVAGAGLGDHMRVGHFAGHEPGFGGRSGLAQLVDPVQGLGRGQFVPAPDQRIADGGQGIVSQRLEAGEHQHGREGVQRQVLAARMQAATAVEDALGVGGRFHPGDGVEQGLHGRSKSRGRAPAAAGAKPASVCSLRGPGRQFSPSH
jgi:hypothetical protein